MNMILRYSGTKNQYAVSLLSVAVVSGLCLFVRDVLDYKVVGYILLVVVSLLAIFLRIVPVLLGAALSALVLDFLFIKPYYTLHIDSPQDALMLLMFFVIALINAVLTYKIRRMEQIAQAREVRWNTMKLYNTLLDSLSHELRTPISTIMGATGTLQGQPALSEENRMKLLSEMEKASLRLNHQVENLLNMSRLESGFIAPKPDWVDVGECVYNVIARLNEELAFHKVNVKKEDYLPLFKLDYGLTEQVIYNLIFNASQYTPKGAAIEVAITYKPEVDFEFHEGGPFTCMIAISDDGEGFPDEERDKVFDKFYRLKHSKTGGSGLGLSIVKGFVEAQHGKVTLENNDNGGATFRLLFPAPVMHTKDLENE